MDEQKDITISDIYENPPVKPNDPPTFERSTKEHRADLVELAKLGQKLTEAAGTEKAAEAASAYESQWIKALISGPESELSGIYILLSLNSRIYGKSTSERSHLLKEIQSHLTPEQREKLDDNVLHYRQIIKAAGALQVRADAVKPQLEKELLKEKYKGLTIKDLLDDRSADELADTNDEKTKLFLQALAIAELSARPIKTPEVITTPLDKFNERLYEIAAAPVNNNEIPFDVPVTAHKPNAPEAHIKALLYFDDDIITKYKTSKSLTAYDKLIASAVYSIWRDNHDEAGRCMTSLNAIHNCINKTSPNKTQLKKTYDSIMKQSVTRITIDNHDEAEKYNYDYYCVGNAALLDVRVIKQVDRNGKTAKVGILILAEPPAIAFSKAHNNQLTDIPIDVFKSGITQTEANLKIQDYLIKRISKAKNEYNSLQLAQNKKYTQKRQKEINNKSKFVILTKTLYENTGRTENRTEKLRARKRALEYLKHFEKCGWIESATITKDNSKIKITLPKKRPIDIL